MKGAREVRRQTGLWSLRPGQIFPLLPASVYPSCKMGLRLPPLGRFSEPGWLKSGWKGSGGLSPPPKPRKENVGFLRAHLMSSLQKCHPQCCWETKGH